MAVVLYQRAEPRQKEWLPLLSQQIRLRNLTQILLINPTKDEGEIYFTLHVSPMSAPFFTSTKAPAIKVTIWNKIQTSLCSARLSATACIVRVWTAQGEPVLSWGVHFKGLHYLGHREEWDPRDYLQNTLLFSTPFGTFTSLRSLLVPPIEPQRFLQIKTLTDSSSRHSYTLKNLVALHRLQRSVLEEHELCEKLKVDIAVSGYGIECKGAARRNPVLVSERLIEKCRIGQMKLRLKEEIESIKLKVSSLTEEKGRAEGRIRRLKKESSSYEDMTSEIVARIHSFTTERINLKDTKTVLVGKGQNLGKLRGGVFLRKKQLISELLQIYPLALVDKSKKYSINGVQLPNAEDYGSEGGGQISVALGYTAHLTAMLAFFLDIPCRYPIRHFGSRSRIIDHITVQIPDKEREFPLYFKGKKDVYCAYAVYLLNKNIAQLRWYCALSTPDLRASLPNLVELLTSRLVIPGWPPNLGEALEIAQEITEDEEIDSQLLLETELTMSLDQGLDKLHASESGEVYSTENPGGNSTALGEIQHGRGQDRFLSGWKKKTYIETDDFDPKWLLDSMNLDFDTGRRFSMSASSPPARPVVLISEELHNNKSSRRRRVGQVVAPSLNSLGGDTSSCDQVNLAVNSNLIPSRDIIQLELDIKEFERRKSRGAPSPCSQESISVSSKNLLVPPPQDENWVTDEEKSSDNGVTKESSSNLLLQVKYSEVCNSVYHIPPPVIEISPTSEQTLVPIESLSIGVNREKETDNHIKDNNTQDDKELKIKLVDTSSSDCKVESASDCDNNKKCVDVDNSRNEDSSLWIRTEALLGAQSFNMVRRRMSTSEST